MSRLTRMEALVEKSFSPVFMQLMDESNQHSRGQETHYKLTLVAQAFEGLRAVQRHQKVYALLQEEMQDGLHAVSLHLYSPAEWQVQPDVPDSPTCRGGSKVDK